MKKRLFILCILLLQLNLFSKIFKFNYSDLDKYELIIKGNFKVYLNNKYKGLQTNEMKGILKIHQLDKDKIQANGKVYHYSKSIRDNSIIGFRVDKFEESKFILDSNGIISFSSNPIFPLLKNLPFFPDTDLKIDDVYKGYGKIGIILYDTEDIEEIEIMITARYSGVKEYRGNKYDFFDISFDYGNIISNGKIKKANGRHNLEFYFDSGSGKPVFMKDKFIEEFRLTDNDILKRDGFFLFFYRSITPMDKKEILEDLTDDIDKKILEDIDFKEKEEGISITINNLKFKPNSTELLVTEKNKLEELYRMLSKIKNRSFMIIGHTALFGTEDEQMQLSIDRAKIIAEYLVNKGISQDRVFYSGKGAKEPVAPNDSEENMKKNRRVEIIILED